MRLPSEVELFEQERARMVRIHGHEPEREPELLSVGVLIALVLISVLIPILLLALLAWTGICMVFWGACRFTEKLANIRLRKMLK